MNQQSPIDIRDAIYADFGDGSLKIRWTGDIHGHVHQGDHGVKVEFASDNRQYIQLSGKKYHLRQFHFHHPSEHWVDGNQHTMELHIVHQNSSDGTLAVIGIFIEPAKTKGLTPSLLMQISSVLNEGTNSGSESSLVHNPKEFLPKNWKDHYRYEGSLTTSPYSENVSWVVIKDALEIDKTKLSKLISKFKAEARFPEPLNRRYVLATFKSDDQPKGKK